MRSLLLAVGLLASISSAQQKNADPPVQKVDDKLCESVHER